jgi:predicted alpha/beta superfamily hydrolase
VVKNYVVATLCKEIKKLSLSMKSIYRFFVFVLLITICHPGNFAYGQDTVRNVSFHGRLDSIKSSILSQKRLIQVFIPPNYKPGSGDKYDVLYVLDGGNWNTGLIAQVQNFVEGQGFMPSTIIVSVLGIDRNKDLTPTRLEGWKTSGGADNFLGFIKDELIPYVNQTYPSNGDNTLWGHSLGGMFVMYAMLKEPATFKSYIAVDPSLWWDKCYVPKMAASRLPALTGLNTTLFIGGREGVSLKEMKIDTMDIVLKKIAPASLSWKLVAYPDETHSSVRLKTTFDGLKFSYAGLTSNIEFHPMSGLVLKDKPIKIWYFDDTTKVRYTLDGTAPTIASKKVQPEITIAGPAKVTYKRFSMRSNHDKSTTGDFTIEAPLRPIAKQKNVKSGGFNYSYYEGDWDTWPELKNIKPARAGITNSDFDIDKLPRKKNYALVIDGLLEAKEEGYYIFVLDADKNSKLYLGNRLLIQWDGNYTRTTYSYILPLSKGFYPLRLEYLHKNEDFKLKMSYLTPSAIDSKNLIPIPLEVQYNQSKK